MDTVKKSFMNNRYQRLRMKQIRTKSLTSQNVTASSSDIIHNNVGVNGSTTPIQSSTTPIQSSDVGRSHKLPNKPATFQSQVLINSTIINNDPMLINESTMDPSVDDMCEPASSAYKESSDVIKCHNLHTEPVTCKSPVLSK